MVIVCLCGATGGAWAHGDVHERIGELSCALTVEPGRADLWLQRADLHRQHGELSQATTDVRQALWLEPDWPPALLQQPVHKELHPVMQVAAVVVVAGGSDDRKLRYPIHNLSSGTNSLVLTRHRSE